MKKLFPVIHVHNQEQAQRNVELCKELGCDGAFLINHGHCSDIEFNNLLSDVVKNYQDTNFLVGANFLKKSLLDLTLESKIGMLWVDNGYTYWPNIYPVSYLYEFYERLQTYNIDYYAGVQFKYQPKPEWGIEKSLYLAFPLMDYPTLSGPGTGEAADLNFIRQAYKACDDRASYDELYKTDELAIASGITLENVTDYLPYIDRFLVATSIIDTDSDSHEENFNKERLQKLLTKIKEKNE